jgi:hypothetical protein
MALATTRRWGPTTSLESLFHWGATGAGHAGELGSLQRSDCVQFPVGRVVAMAVHAVWLVGVHAPVVRVDPPVAESAWAEEAGFHVAWGVQVAACMARLADACFLVVCGVQLALLVAQVAAGTADEAQAAAVALWAGMARCRYKNDLPVGCASPLLQPHWAH